MEIFKGSVLAVLMAASPVGAAFAGGNGLPGAVHGSDAACESAKPAGSSESGDGTTVYFDNSSTNWPNVYCYQWVDDSNKNAAWPGEPMTPVNGSVYSYTCATVYPNVIFNNGSGDGMNQTADLRLVDNHIYQFNGTHEEYTGGGDDPIPPTPPTPPGPTPTPDPVGDNLITDYYMVNPNGQVGSNRTVKMSFSDQKSTTALGNWAESDLIAQGVARDVSQAYKGMHERPIVDSYAIYAAYDSENLYIGVQFVYTVWDLYGEGKQPGESKPYNMDGHMCLAFDLDPNKSFDGYINGNGPIWNEQAKGAKFNNGVDAVWMGSTKPGVGTPGFFIPTADGHASYDAAYCKSIPGRYYGYADGLLPSITHIWGQEEFGGDPENLKGNTGFVDLINEIDPSAHTFYEWTFPLSVLGVTEDYIKNNGIGVMYLDKYGTSPVGGTPYDSSYFDNVKEEYSYGDNTSMEKEDEDIITYAPARIGKLRKSGVEGISSDASDGDVEDAEPEYYNLQGVRVYEPASGELVIERRGNVVTKKIFR